MSTYMVVGTLFLGYSVSHMWYITTFPEDPPWLKFFWMNCFISAMCYGFLAPRITSDHLGLSWGCWQFWSQNLLTDMILQIISYYTIYIYNIFIYTYIINIYIYS